MNKYEISLYRINRRFEPPDDWTEEDIAHYKTVKEALEKQIPRKPIGDLHSVPHYRCPACKNAVVMYEDSTRFPYCHHCGQALDWGDI